MAWIVVLILCLVSPCVSFIVTVEPHEEECFFDRVSQGTKMTLMFEVIEGGFLDIDVKITSPDTNVVYSNERESNGKYTFSAHMSGVYTYCFGNKMSSMTSKMVMFSMDVGESSSQGGTDSTHDKLGEMIAELSTGLAGVKHEQEYMEVRERVHRMINDNTNSRVVWWSVFEAFLLVCMTFGQIYYLKRFFEVRRVI